METVKILEVTIDLKKAGEGAEELKKKVDALKASADAYKKTEKENTAEHVNAIAAYKNAASELKALENAIQAQTKANSINGESIQKLEAQNKALRYERDRLTNTTEAEVERAKEINALLDENTAKIKNNLDVDGQRIKNIGNYEEANKPLKAQLKEIVTLMQLMAAKGEDDTEVFKELAIKAGQLKDAMNATNDQIKTFTVGDKFEQRLKMAKGGFDAVSGAVQGVEGSMQALGIENKSAQEGMQKLIALQSIQNGVTAVYEAIQKESAFMLLVTTARTQAAAAAQAIYTAAIGTTTGAAKALRVALLSTGIGAIIIGIGLLIANWDKLTGSQKENEKALKKVNDEMQRTNDIAEEFNQWQQFRLDIIKQSSLLASDASKQELQMSKDRQAQLDEEMYKLREKSKLLEAGSDEAKANDEEYTKKSKELIAEQDKAILLSAKIRTEVKDEEIANAKNEFEIWKLYNEQKPVDTQKSLNKALYIQIETNKKQRAILEAENNNGKLTLSQYNLEIYKLETDNKKQLKAINDAYQKHRLEDTKTKNAEILKDELDRHEKQLKLASDEVTRLNIALEDWKIDHQKRVIINQETLDQELKNTEEAYQKEVELNDAKFAAQQISIDEYLLAQKQAFNAFNENEKAARSEYWTNQIALDQEQIAAKDALSLAAQENTFAAEFEQARQQSELKLAQELEYSNKIVSTKEETEKRNEAITKRYVQRNRQIAMAEMAAKISIASTTASAISTIAQGIADAQGKSNGKAAKVAKLAAKASIAADSVAGSIKAISGAMALGPILGPVVGGIQAAAIITSGLMAIQKINTQKSGLPEDSADSTTSLTDTTATTTSSATTTTSTTEPVLTNVSGSVVARDSNTVDSLALAFSKALKENPMQPVQVIDDVTSKQQSEAFRKKISTY